MKKPSVELRLPILPNMELIATQTAEVISRHMDLTEDQGAEISMALIEACINAFEHSKAENNVFINFLIEDDSLEVRIPDETRLIRISPITVTKMVETIKVVAIILKLKDLFHACLN